MAANLAKISTIRGYAAHARLFAQLDNEAEIVGYIPRAVYTPYAYSPTHAVYMLDGKPVMVAEVKHRTYMLFSVLCPYMTDEQATTEYISRPAGTELLRLA